MSGRRAAVVPAGTVPPGEQVLPGQVVVALLAHGRRMDTYDARDLDRGCRSVVKVLRADRRHEPRVVAATRREGEVLSSLAHPHLVRCYEVHEEPPALVLEVLGGATLAALVEDEPLGLADTAGLGLQLVSVLGYLHRHDWLHLDVKPANVVVDGGRATLIDLSLVGRPGEGRPGAGTRGYLAPEQARGTGLGPATDVWGLAVTLVEALTSDLPHGDEATWDSRRRLPVLHRRAPRAPRLPAGLVPADVGDLLLACLRPDPAARPTLCDVRRVLEAHAHA
ncbi:serine/threonine-protein kinase [Nocardioides aurantiacus]|uniref:Protein kinase-like protein n=1 Tax=Nocardioides aurantiacus TaxID=86796 RepID=A0A3N2CX59_9ACTN|nr:serine/threonine-protein kinase [Nocardioides aurantiacus]ROR92089.1 protein kinase-like protein [Nocardioides aurantiacus]